MSALLFLPPSTSASNIQIFERSVPVFSVFFSRTISSFFRQSSQPILFSDRKQLLLHLLSPFASTLAIVLLLTPLSASEKTAQNIALGKRASFNHPPNYALCTDSDDAIQLTDGEYSRQSSPITGKLRSIWTQKSTVGWSNKNPVAITLDLESVQPISGISFGSAGGAAGVRFPLAVHIAVSDDKKSWTYLGDLVALSNAIHSAPDYEEGYRSWSFATHELRTRGRYVTLLAYGASRYLFSDEIEIYRGDDAWVDQKPEGNQITSLVDFGSEQTRLSAVKARLSHDIRQIQTEIRQSKLSKEQQNQYKEALDSMSKEVRGITELPADFKAILPMHDIHKRAFALRGEAMAQRGMAPITIWQQHRYAWLPLLAEPENDSNPKLNFVMLRNQFHSESLLVTNATNKEQSIRIRWEDGPSDADEGWLQIFGVEWTDTLQGVPVASALLPAERKDGSYFLTVPAGVTRKVWFLVDSSKLRPGSSQGQLSVDKFSIPWQVDVASLAMSAPRLSLTMWDYTNGESSRAIHSKNRAQAIQMMRSNYVDSTWSTSVVLPRPPASAFDAEGKLTEKLNFDLLDEWLSRWPEARRYFIYASVGKSFAGARMETEDFAKRVGSWAQSLSAHMSQRGLKPSQLTLLLIDEPNTDEQDQIIAAWAKAINAMAPDLSLFSDTMWQRPDQAKIQEAITEMDILCPKPDVYQRGGEALRSYFSNLQKQGKELWFYSCSGPTRHFSPQAYYRLQAWHVFTAGAKGQGFWAFGDTSGATSSFMEYDTKRENFSPVFFDGDSIYSSIHWEALREGMRDHEEMSMLQDVIRQIKDSQVRETAQARLDSLIHTITATDFISTPSWSTEEGLEMMDAHQNEIRKMLLDLGTN